MCALRCPGRFYVGDLARLGHDRPVDDPRTSTAARAALAAVAERLAAAGVAPELLVTTVPAHRVLGVVVRRASFRRIGEGYLLGALLVTADGGVFEPGRIARASRQVLPGHQSESARERRDLRQRLLDARLPEGSTVVIDARPLPLDDSAALAAERGPLVLRAAAAPSPAAARPAAASPSAAAPGAQLLVRWMPTAADSALRPLDDYLAERLDLALTALASSAAREEHP